MANRPPDAITERDDARPAVHGPGRQPGDPVGVSRAGDRVPADPAPLLAGGLALVREPRARVRGTGEDHGGSVVLPESARSAGAVAEARHGAERRGIDRHGRAVARSAPVRPGPGLGGAGATDQSVRRLRLRRDRRRAGRAGPVPAGVRHVPAHGEPQAEPVLVRARLVRARAARKRIRRARGDAARLPGRRERPRRVLGEFPARRAVLERRPARARREDVPAGRRARPEVRAAVRGPGQDRVGRGT